MDRSRKAARTLIAAAAITVFFGAASPCHGEDTQGQGGGSTFVAFGLAINGLFDLAPRVGLLHGSEYMFVLTGDALVVLPLFKFGRSGALDLTLGVPAIMWVTGHFPEFMFTAGGAARLRFGLGSRWSLLVHAGAGGMFVLDAAGFHLGQDSHYNSSWWPALKVSAEYRL